MRNSRIDSGSRLIRADAAAIYDAYINPADLVRWLPPTGMNGRIEIFDPRAGGEYRIVLTYDDGAQSSQGKTTEDADVVHGRFLELVPNQKIVQSVQFDSDDPRFAGEMVMTWLLTPAPEGTTVRITAENVRLASRPPTTPPASPQPSPTWRPSSKADEVFGPRPDGRTENARGV